MTAVANGASHLMNNRRKDRSVSTSSRPSVMRPAQLIKALHEIRRTSVDEFEKPITPIRRRAEHGPVRNRQTHILGRKDRECVQTRICEAQFTRRIDLPNPNPEWSVPVSPSPQVFHS